MGVRVVGLAIVAMLVSLAALVVGAALVWDATRNSGDPTHGYRVSVSPHSALLPADCLKELRADGIQHGDEQLCTMAVARRPWFEIHLRNVGDDNGYPVCTLTAYDAGGHELFEQAAWFPVGFPAGPSAIRGMSFHMVWYLGAPTQDQSYVEHQPWTPREISRYSASCHGRPDSQVPI
jgi:hypothetical protein